MGVLRPWVRRLSTAPAAGERLRVERVLAIARVFLALTSLGAIYLDPGEPSRYRGFAYGLIGIYALLSVGIVMVLRRKHDVMPRFALSIQAFDIVLPGLLSVFTSGPSSPFFFYFFPLMTAAFRWGLRAAMITASLGVGFVFGDAMFIMYSRNVAPSFGQVEINRVVLRIAYTVLMGLLLGLAAEEEKELRAENVFIARLAEKVRSAESSLAGAMQEMFGELLRLFQSRRAQLILREASSARTYVWDAQLLTSGAASAQLSEAPVDRREDLMFPVMGQTWYAQRHTEDHSANNWTFTGLAGDGRILRQPFDFRPPAQAAALHESSSVIGAQLNFGESWAGRVLLLDPKLRGTADLDLRFLQNLLRQVGPAIYNLYLLRRLRSRAGAIERARVARELHDGAIQSLIAAEMQVDVLRRRSSQEAPALHPELERVQALLRQEVLAMRELMQQMKPPEVGPEGLIEFLAETVDRFRRDTGIAARFASEVDEVSLSTRVCREIARIAQEALVNVRKHSGAAHVQVLFQAESGQWRLVVEDDGRGFQFEGRRAAQELERSHAGPTIIRERVRVIGGELTVESRPGKGTRLEVTLPQNARATYA